MRGDAKLLRQVITNLLSNAIKFTKTGWVALAVDRHPSNADAIEIKVTDTGRGIAESSLRSIFDLFSQVETDEAPYEVGTGVGLSIVRQLVGLMEGSIHVESQPAKGSTFTVTLPLPRCELEAVAESHDEREGGARQRDLSDSSR